MSSRLPPPTLRDGGVDLDRAVRERYSEGAQETVAELCCPVSYDPALLEVIPEEVLARDYGCGDPSRHLATGETVLDLGSGTGKIAFIAAQVVGPEGRVIGVDMNDEMLAVARTAAPVVAERLGFANVEFRKGRIEDLATDRAAVETWLGDRTLRTDADLAALETHMAELRRTRPLIPDGSVDVVVSNCVLNLVLPERKEQLVSEIFRVLRRGGRVVISDIVSDEDVPAHMAADPELWSGCVSGAWREDAFLEAFERAGFHGIEILERGAEPWRVVEGIEFRSVTVQAYKGKQGACLEQGHAVVYRGPWSAVQDDDGHTFPRGKRMAVCGKTYRLMTSGPYADQVLGLEPAAPVDEADAEPFACTGSRERTPAEMKGASAPRAPSTGTADCGDSGCC